MKHVSSCHKYEFTAVKKDGTSQELLCIVGDKAFDSEFILNSQQYKYSKITMKTPGTLYTKEPIGCVATGMHPESRNTKNAAAFGERTRKLSIIGSDFISGKGIRASKRFPDVLEASGKHDDTRFKIISLYTAPQIDAIYKDGFKSALAGDADEILYVITPGDIPIHVETKEYFYEPRQDAIRSPVSLPAKKHFPLYDYLHYRLDVLYQQEREAIRLKASFSHLNYAGTEEFKNSIRKMKLESADKGKRFSCVIFPYLAETRNGKYLYEDIHRYILSFLKSENIPAIDLSDSLADGDYPGKCVSKCDLMPGTATHGKAGKLIYAFLSKNNRSLEKAAQKTNLKGPLKESK